MTVRDVLSDACAVPERVYLLFPADVRITLYAQQVRALELIDRLAAEPWIERVSSIAVIGGGASGMTAAAALMTAGLREELVVTLFESCNQIMPLQSGAHNKLLAPHLIDWPMAGATEDRALLPVMGWRQAVADKVAIDLLAQFQRFGVVVRTGSVVEAIGPAAHTVAIDIRHAGAVTRQNFDLVIVAAGFGLESQPSGIAALTPPYWRVHPEQAPALAAAAPDRRILISGLGDGGLIDFVLFACPGLSHEQLCDRLVNSGDSQRLVPEIDHIERQIWETPSPIDDIEAAYAGLDIDQLARALILPSLAPHVEFSLLTRDPQLFHRGTAPLNRLAATLVMRAMELADNGTRVRRLIGARHLPDRDNQTVYEIDGVEHQETFDTVVVRHGDTSAQAWDFGNTDIAVKVADLRARRQAISVRPQTPKLPDALAAAFDQRQFAARPTRIRLVRQGQQVRWEGDIEAGDVGRLWRAPTAAVHIEIDFAPDDPPSKLDFALCRLLIHAEPQARVAGGHKAAWITLTQEVPRRAGDKTRTAVELVGTVEPGRNVFVADPDQLADKLEAAMDDGLLALVDDRMAAAAADPALCPVDFYASLHVRIHDRWAAWRSHVIGLPSTHRRRVLSMYGGLLDEFGSPDPWNSLRVGPRCVDDELLPAFLLHLAAQELLEDFGMAGAHRMGNVARVGPDDFDMPAAHFCGTRWVAKKAGRPQSIDSWERSWPGDPWVPSCLVLSARQAQLLPRYKFNNDVPSDRLLAQPGDRTPVIVGSADLKQALRAGEDEARAFLKNALNAAYPEI
ncbi:MAG: ABC-three component system protein [Sphingopyxis sp.]